MLDQRGDVQGFGMAAQVTLDPALADKIPKGAVIQAYGYDENVMPKGQLLNRDHLDKALPDGFVFENVTGLLNMEGGRVFAAVQEAFSSVMPSSSISQGLAMALKLPSQP